ncbi:unnamed protein product [Enterobius vermicularis]|uniref:PH domain-containing protein n=1 Tax=Enterobius vermicularis TaxID=51028 RepID=A0A0N4VNH0_ENTVE|nr:unnamed protein product [Enterobius vermicularis]
MFTFLSKGEAQTRGEDGAVVSGATFIKQKREYKDEKKRVASEMAAALRDPTVVIMADWLKVRGTLRKWKRYYCVLVPGLFVIYRNDKIEKHGQWIGSILLNMCSLIERPSKKNGFCFKLFNPSDRYIWASRGPHGEIFGALTVHRLPGSYIICRAASEQAGGCWMDALQLALRCNGLLMKTMLCFNILHSKEDDNENYEQAISETEAEKHFDELIENQSHSFCSHWMTLHFCTLPVSFIHGPEFAQTEDLADENKSLIWSLLKQVRPGMDLSRVTLPTFILEPRSFLEKLADFYYHVDILSRAAAEQDPYNRALKVITFYLSGFYKKPKGLKKPYNPILGETFRCKWEHPDGSTTFYIAEQVYSFLKEFLFAVFFQRSNLRFFYQCSCHFIQKPPDCSLAGFNIAGTILAKSKYYGNSISAMMIGSLRITLLDYDETYTVTLPYANCKGIMIGTLCMEYGGEVKIECNRHPYICTLDFKLKPFLGGSLNAIKGTIRRGKEVVALIGGHWDSEITLNENGKETVLWAPSPEIVKQRLTRFEIPLENQGEWESKKLWLKVSNAIVKGDQVAATVEKSILEDAQRARAKERDRPHEPRLFKYYSLSRTYEYLHAE